MKQTKRIPSSSTFPERNEDHAGKQWHNLSFNHKTTLSMGLLVPMACKEVYPGEFLKLGAEVKMRFAPLFLPIMHQCYYTLDWYYVNNEQLFANADDWKSFIKQDPITGGVGWAFFDYARADAVYTDGVLNYMGFNAPPGGGTLISKTRVSALPPVAYVKIYDEYYRNDQIQTPRFAPLISSDNTAAVMAMLSDLRVLRRNWPRDYYTSATPTPQQGESVLIPSFATDPETGDYIAQRVLSLDGTNPPGANLGATTPSGYPAGERYLTDAANDTALVLQLSSTIRDFRYAAQMQEYLERSLRAGDRYNDFIYSNFKWNPNPLFIDRPVWIGGSSGPVVISDVMSTAEIGTQKVGSYAGKALVSGATPQLSYQVPDYGFCIAIMTVYPKASYYSGFENMWKRETKLDYMWEQFALIGDQPIKNKEVWFSWYDADIEWNDEIFGYLPQYAQFRYSNDIVSGQMRTLWESFHLGRKFIAASDVVLNSEFITCTPDIGRVFDVDAESGEHEIYVHAYMDIQILRRLPKNALPSL